MRERLRNILWLVLVLAGLCNRLLAADATITVVGSEQPGDTSSITIAFNGFSETIQYGQFSTQASIASTFGAMFSNDYLGFGLCAHANGSVVTFHLKGTATFGSLSISGSTASFQLAASGFGSRVSVADTGTIQLTVNGVVAATSRYTLGSTPGSIAAGLAGGVTSTSPVTLSEVNGSLYMVAKTGGANTNYSYTLQTTSWDSADFGQPSFLSMPISGSLTSGADAGSGAGAVYSYSIPSYVSGQTPLGYDAAGNIVGYSDSVNGVWGFGYDSMNRLTGAAGIPPGQSQQNYCWNYDSFGNRTLNVNVPCSQNAAPTQDYNANNQMTGGLVQYDSAGDVTGDVTGGKSYLYDAEGRICAVQFTVSGINIMTGYIYNAEGERVSKGSITSWSCDPSTNGFQATTDYYIGPSGEQLTELSPDGKGNMAPQRTYVYANGQLMATLDPDGTHFRLTDWLGTLRAGTNYAGERQSTYMSLPFGEQLGAMGNIPDPHHFTGKERDTESGNDYFGARYYSSAMGRFMSPDWSAKAEPVPYAKLDNPQSLNLYAYLLDNPLAGIDANGHCGPTAVNCDEQAKALERAGHIQGEQQQNNVTASAKGNSVTYTYPDGSKVVLTGDHPFRDNNPGDLRSGHGSIGRDGGFAIYPTLDAGVNALGATLTGKYADSTISDTMKSFAPGSDGNDPVKYAATLAAAVGVPVSTKISALTPAQLMTFQYNIAVAEGYNAAGNTSRYIAPPQ